MPYTVVLKTGDKPWKIFKDGAEVGASDTKAKALRSVGYREQADTAKEER